jgi:hypothetical protein
MLVGRKYPEDESLGRTLLDDLLVVPEVNLFPKMKDVPEPLAGEGGGYAS